jgi:ERCC4-type nuclease
MLGEHSDAFSTDQEVSMSALEEEITERLKNLSPEKREQVLEYTRSLGDAPRRNALKSELWRFRNTFSPEEAEEIKRVIEEECERVDPDGW